MQHRSALLRSALLELVVTSEAVTGWGASDAEGLLQLLDEAQPDVVLIEADRTPWPAAPLVAQLAERSGARLLAIGSTERRVTVPGLSEPTLPRSVGVDGLLDAVYGTPAGSEDDWLVRDGAADIPAGSLRPRDRALLSCLSAGMTTRDIAGRLQISERAARAACERVLAKLDVQSRAQAVAVGIRLGLLEPTAPLAPDPSTADYEAPNIRVSAKQRHQPNVVLAHPSRLIARALANELEGHAVVVAHTVLGSATVALAEVSRPEVVVLADTLLDGIAEGLLPDLIRTGARVLVVIDDPGRVDGLHLLKLGVSGISSSPSVVGEVAEAVVRVAAGEAVLPGRTAETLVSEWRAATPDRAAGSRPTLSRREHELLAAMADGLSTKALALRMGIAVKTVEAHKTRVFQKLGVRSQSEAIALVGHVAAGPHQDGSVPTTTVDTA